MLDPENSQNIVLATQETDPICNIGPCEAFANMRERKAQATKIQQAYRKRAEQKEADI